MQQRVLGSTGQKVAPLGFGAMRLPLVDGHVDYDYAVPLLRQALQLGVNYIDSAFIYCNGTSEAAVGQALAGWPREQVVLSTKQGVNSSDDAVQWRGRLESQLRRLDTPYIDIYNCHGLSWTNFQAYVAPTGGVLDLARRAQAEGLIRHLSLSCHDTPENMLLLLDTGEFATITLQYNLLDRRNAEVIDYAHDRGVGVVVMGPVGGGRLALSPEVLAQYTPGGWVPRSTAEIALRFVLANPAVSVAISGMSAADQLVENVATASRDEPLSQAELQQIEAALGEIRRLADLYCTGCGYCMPCPHGVNIPENFQLVNYYRLYEATDMAKSAYFWLAKQGKGADRCLECGECEPKCPQNIRIPEQLKEVIATLG